MKFSRGFLVCILAWTLQCTVARASGYQDSNSLEVDGEGSLLCDRATCPYLRRSKKLMPGLAITENICVKPGQTCDDGGGVCQQLQQHVQTKFGKALVRTGCVCARRQRAQVVARNRPGPWDQGSQRGGKPLRRRHRHRRHGRQHRYRYTARTFRHQRLVALW